MLLKRNPALFLDQLPGLKPVIKALLDFMSPLSDFILSVDFLQTKLLNSLFLELFLRHGTILALVFFAGFVVQIRNFIF